MSQKKVDAYKAEKANRQKQIKKEKRMLLLEKTLITVFCVVVIGWIGYSTYGKISDNSKENEVVEQTEVNVSAIEDYMSGLTVEE